MRIEWAADERQKALLSKWVAKFIWPNGGHSGFGNCQAMAIIEGNDLIAGCIFYNWDPECGVIEISAASTDKRWMSRPILKEMFEFVFLGCHCQAVVMRISDENKPMHRIAKAYGFEQYVIPRLRGRNANENVFVLTDDAWKTNRWNRKTEVH